MTHRRWLWAAVFLAIVIPAGIACGSGKQGKPPLRVVADVALPGPANRFDYLALDRARNELYVAHMNAGELLVVDIRRRRVVRTIAAPGVHGVIVIPSLHRAFATATDVESLFTIDTQSGRVIRRAPAGDYPDGLAYDPVERRVFVSDESGGIEAVFDQSGRRIATVDLGGDAGNVQYDPQGRRVLVAVQARNDIAVIDPRTNRIEKRVSLRDCDSPHGLHLDPPRRLAFVACDGNAALLTVDLNTMKTTGRAEVGGSPDVLDFDTASRWLYVAAESGEVAVFAERGRSLRKLGQWKLAASAHAVAVDPRTHRSYFPLEDGGQGKPVLRIMRPR